MLTMIFELLEEMQNKMFGGDWKGLEDYYREKCKEIAGENNALEIESVDFTKYTKVLKKAFGKALKKSKKASVIYFEYDLDNDWASNFFICTEYSTLDEVDDDWACEWARRIKGPKFKQLGDIYLRTDHFCTTPEATAMTIYLIARTVSCLGAIVSEMETENLAITIGYHDQDPVMRIKESS